MMLELAYNTTTMGLSLVAGDVLAATAEALVLTVDGIKRGMEGALARQFERRWPDDWTDISRTVKYPIPLGRAVGIEWDGDCPWRLIILASTLHHIEAIDDGAKRQVVRSAFGEVLQIGHRHRCRSLATTVMRGGWRLSLVDAYSSMFAAYQASTASQSSMAVQIFFVNADDLVLLRQYKLAELQRYLNKDIH